MKPKLLFVLAGACLLGCDNGSHTMDATIDGGPADARDASDIAPPPDTGPSPIDYPMPTAANAVTRDDPRWNGQYHFLYDAFGTEILGEWPPADFMLALMTSEPTVFGNQYASFGFVADPNDQFPFGFKRGLQDTTQVHETCAVCHTARLPDGRVWFGMPNTQLDLGRFQIEVNRRWMAAGHPSLLSANGMLQSAFWGPGRAEAAGDAPYSIPVDYPSYFFLSSRTHVNSIGTSRDVRTEASLSIYTFGAGAPNAMTARVPFPPRPVVDLLVSFVSTLDAPAPPSQDPALVARGQMVFHAARCDSCHHVGMPNLDDVTTYDTRMSGAELIPGDDPMFPRGTIRTDPLNYGEESGGLTGMVMTDGGVGMGTADGGDQGLTDLIAFILHNGLAVMMTDGYRTQDLRGVAYTAPYLHNGSVPTLEALLMPASMRPAQWMHGSFMLDTTLEGNSNRGHEFGTTLSDPDKTALVAYLRSL